MKRNKPPSSPSQPVETKSKKIKPSSAKGKGRKLQQWICQKISDLTGYEWGRSGEDKPIESRPMGQSGCDVRMESQVQSLFPFAVECKWQETWAIPAWIKQAKQNCPEGQDWLLFIRKNNMKPYSIAIMDAERFFSLLQENKNLRDKLKKEMKKR